MTMSSFRVRPKFEMESNKTIEEIITIIKEKLKINTHHLHGQAMHDHITIRVNQSHRHYWSPQLSVQLYREPEDKVTRLVGVYGPMPNVWTLFTLVYLAVVALTMYIISQMGQKLGAAQTYAIHYFFEEALGEPVPEV